MGGKLDLVRTFLVCIDDSAWFLKVVCCFSRPSLW
jgi:predicted neuraminidase